LAKVDVARRAEIGRDRSAKTRGHVLNSARGLFAERGFEAVGVDDVIKRAEVARGTFYLHFADIEGLRAAVADELVQALVFIRRPDRSQESDPVARLAGGCFAFIRQALLDPEWGALVARAAWTLPTVGRAARENMTDDLRRALLEERIAAISLELGAALVLGAVLQTMRLASEKRLKMADAKTAVIAILSSLGVSRREAAAIVRRLAAD
jgi:AcrR family transcriptional regulator